MTVLVTGATGLLGSAVVRALTARAQAPVRVLVRAGSARGDLASLPVEVAFGDLTDAASLRAALEGCRGLYHVAADYRLWVPDPDAMVATNVGGTRTLMEVAKAAGVERIVYTSSVAVLGLHPEGAPADESTPSTLDDMVGPYKRSKFLAEMVVRRMVADDGLPAVIVNPATLIGPGDVRPTPSGRVVIEAASGRMPAFVDTGLNLVHVDDVARGHLLAYERGVPGERYILGGENLTLQQVLCAIAGIIGRGPPRVRLPHALVLPAARAAETWCRTFGGEPFATVDGVRMARHRMYFSSAKAERHLGYTARPAQEALADAIAFFRRRGLI